MKRKLLLAETEHWAVELVGTVADEMGLECVRATTGPSATDLFVEHAPHVAVIDAHLPVVDGGGVARSIRKTMAGRIVPVLLTSAIPSDADVLCQRLGVTDVLCKPFDLARVKGVLGAFFADVESPVCASSIALEGEAVDPTALPALLIERKRRWASGRLIVVRGRIRKQLEISGGDLVGARSNASSDSWPGWLARDPWMPPSRRSAAAQLARIEPLVALDDLRARGYVLAAEQASVRQRWLTAVAVDVLTSDCELALWVEGDVAPFGDFECVDGFSLARLGLRRRPAGTTLDEFLPAPATLLERRVEHIAGDITTLEQQIAALANDRCTVDEVMALGRLVQLDVRTAIATLVATRLLEPTTATVADAAAVVGLPPALAATGLRSSGELGRLTGARLLATAWAVRATGILELQWDDQVRTVYLANGDIVFAKSSDPSHRLGEILLRTGAITSEDHRLAIAAQPAGSQRRIGAILISHEALTLRELQRGLVEQVRDIAGEVARTVCGRYEFRPDELDTRDRVRAGTTVRLILDACTELELGPEHLSHLPGDADKLTMVWPQEALVHLALKPSERTLLERLERGLTVPKLMLLATDMKSSLQILYGLIGLCVVQPAEPLPRGIDDARAVDGCSATVLESGVVLGYDDLVEAHASLQQAYAELAEDNRRLRRRLERVESLAVPTH